MSRAEYRIALQEYGTLSVCQIAAGWMDHHIDRDDIRDWATGRLDSTVNPTALQILSELVIGHSDQYWDNLESLKVLARCVGEYGSIDEFGEFWRVPRLLAALQDHGSMWQCYVDLNYPRGWCYLNENYDECFDEAQVLAYVDEVRRRVNTAGKR